jgi:hypothetical protein
MADGVAITAGSGTTILTDDTGAGGHAQVMKLAVSADGSPTLIPADQHKGLAVNVQGLPEGLLDTFGKLQVVQSLNEVDVQFFRDVPANLVSVTTANGGTATQTGGTAQFAASTATNGSVIAQSYDTVQYRSGGELFALFTAAFLDGGVAGSVQRIGLFDGTNGFFLGYEGTSFGVTVRSNSVDTTVARASWNGDLLTGVATSHFTRGNVPESINPALFNIYRIRFGWLGSAPVKFEVLSPDGEWVCMHTVRQPNLSATPSIANPELPVRAEVTKTSGATDVRLNSNCWGAGSTYDRVESTGAGQLQTALNSVINLNPVGLASIRFRCNTTTTGTFIVEATLDGVNWVTHPQVIKLVSGNDLWVLGAETPTAGIQYLVNASAYRGIRVRTASTLGAPVAFAYSVDSLITMLKSIDVAPAPHNIGYTVTNRTAQYTATQTGAALWTPASGRAVTITAMQIQAGGTTAANVQVWFGGTADTTYTRGTDQPLFDGEFAPSATNKPGVYITFPTPIRGTVDFVLRVTSSAALNPLTVNVWGYES